MTRDFYTMLVTTVDLDDNAGTCSVGTSAVSPELDEGAAQNGEVARLSVAAWSRVFACIQREILAEYGPDEA